MLIQSLDAMNGDEQITADLCLVGSGPAALTIASELRDKDIRIVILESGGLDDREVGLDAPAMLENIGEERITELSLVRSRIFGGTSHVWSGRCAMFDEIDFRTRSWVPMSGWPLRLEEFSPFISRANRYLGIECYIDEARAKTYHGSKGDQFPDIGSPLSLFFWTFSRDSVDRFEYMRFGPSFLKANQKNVRVVYNATAVHVETTDDASVVTGIEASDRRGRKFKVKASLVVLCCGGIENPRLLLASNRVASAGLGNARDLVGRYLMDHPRAKVAEFDPLAAEPLREAYSSFRLKSKSVVAAGFALSPEIQERERLLNCAAWFEEERAVDDPWDAIKRLRQPGRMRNKISDVRAVLSAPGLLFRGVRRRIIEQRGVAHKLERLFLSATVEQVPNPESRLVLSEKKDSLGIPLPKIDWRIGSLERQSVLRLVELINTEFPKLGFAAPTIISNPRFLDAAHPSGTTRMAENPAYGVVDANCAVHGVRGLYIAGSSVFPTAGHANPTLLIVLMAIRLAEHLHAQLKTIPIFVTR
jgi:choline dehydrogenase-like flavoprotein